MKALGTLAQPRTQMHRSSLSQRLNAGMKTVETPHRAIKEMPKMFTGAELINQAVRCAGTRQ